MNHATTLRHSRAHRDAAKRNAKALDAKFVTRITIETSEKAAYKLLVSGFQPGVRLVHQHLANYGRAAVLVFEVEAGCSFAFDPYGPHFEIKKTERVRK